MLRRERRRQYEILCIVSLAHSTGFITLGKNFDVDETINQHYVVSLAAWNDNQESRVCISIAVLEILL